MSRYDGADCYVYPGTEVLRNKADIRDQTALDAFEADVTALRMLELAEQAGYFIDFETVDQSEMYAVMSASFNRNEKPLTALLERITAIIEP